MKKRLKIYLKEFKIKKLTYNFKITELNLKLVNICFRLSFFMVIKGITVLLTKLEGGSIILIYPYEYMSI